MYSGYSIVRYNTRKINAGGSVIQTLPEIENIFNDNRKYLTMINRKSTNWIFSDEGKKYAGKQFQKWLMYRGIIHEVTTTYSLESYGNVGCLNRTLVDMAGTVFDSMNGINGPLLAEAVNTFSSFRNRLFTKGCRETKTPYKIIDGTRPNARNCRVFQSEAIVHVPAQKREKHFCVRDKESISVGCCEADAY